jgi:hypothetical protein
VMYHSLSSAMRPWMAIALALMLATSAAHPRSTRAHRASRPAQSSQCRDVGWHVPAISCLSSRSSSLALSVVMVAFIVRLPFVVVARHHAMPGGGGGQTFIQGPTSSRPLPVELRTR